MEPRWHFAGGEYVITPFVWASEPAGAVWRILAGENGEGCALSIVVLMVVL